MCEFVKLVLLSDLGYLFSKNNWLVISFFVKNKK